MRGFVNFLIRKIKKDPDYKLDEDISLIALLEILFRRFFALLNGVFRQLLLLRKPGFWFISRGVSLLASSKLEVNGVVTIGKNVTLDAMSKNGIRLGSNITIPDNCFFRCTGVISDIGEGLIVGDNTGFGHNNFINAQGGVVIGCDVIIGPYVNILAENHNFGDSTIPIRKQGVTRKGIIIESDVWIGAGVSILDGVKIGKGTVIGAGSIVTKSIPEYSIALGNPCKVIKSRK
ncbi:acyltransferase [Pseudoalteromonas piscicida]|uniref:Transferase n=1 Tax=Pseudoalteromonas piscicida TaxID=43662 RepID=A0A2A5JW44_PSEO7|nr:acyltransferase [Pseudoalteromonas piscicida]PCK33628.1 transferase [Pseudoalteromonas piscicida]